MKLINIIKTNPLADRMKKLAFPVTALAVAAIFTTVCCQAADPVDLPQSLLEGDASGYVTSLHPNIGPKIKLIHISKGMYTGKYKLGEDFYPFMGKIVDGKLKGTVTLSDDDTLDFTLELDDRGVVHYLDDFPEGVREIRFNSEIEKRLLPLRWKAANESHSPYQKQRHFTIPLPGEILMTMNWIPGDGKNIPDHWTSVTETTVSQWEALIKNVVGDNTKPADIRDPNEVKNFLTKLTKRESEAGRLPKGFVFKLPNATLWQYDCRAGTSGDYNVDGVDPKKLGWFWENSGNCRSTPNTSVCDNAVQPVALKMSNAYGLYDQHGNAYERVEDNTFCGGGFFSYTKDCKSNSQTFAYADCYACRLNRNCKKCNPNYFGDAICPCHQHSYGPFLQDEHSKGAVDWCCNSPEYRWRNPWAYRTCLGFRVVLAPEK